MKFWCVTLWGSCEERARGGKKPNPNSCAFRLYQTGSISKVCFLLQTDQFYEGKKNHQSNKASTWQMSSWNWVTLLCESWEREHYFYVFHYHGAAATKPKQGRGQDTNQSKANKTPWELCLFLQRVKCSFLMKYHKSTCIQYPKDWQKTRVSALVSWASGLDSNSPLRKNIISP